MFSAVLFDMDGVIIDSERYYQDRICGFLSREKISFKESQIREFIGLTDQQIFEGLLQMAKRSAHTKISEKEIVVFLNSLQPDIKKIQIMGTVDLIKNLDKQGFKIALCSSSSRKAIEYCIKTLEIESCFDLVLGREDVTDPKPDPEIYLKAAEILRVDAWDCLVCEDSPIGIRAAKRAGMSVYALYNLFFKGEQDADIVFKDLSHAFPIISAPTHLKLIQVRHKSKEHLKSLFMRQNNGKNFKMMSDGEKQAEIFNLYSDEDLCVSLVCRKNRDIYSVDDVEMTEDGKEQISSDLLLTFMKSLARDRLCTRLKFLDEQKEILL